ncbi:hypothetical protein REMIM1_PE00150 (plasmid) [Rhizobium etli bv. mimosae str. Mim1]|nr:hypothetical protein REMIM1_PE00150 [Rhizobium etli bv. mimosae str. Mim1]
MFNKADEDGFRRGPASGPMTWSFPTLVPFCMAAGVSAGGEGLGRIHAFVGPMCTRILAGVKY